jgi:competence protein ComEC
MRALRLLSALLALPLLAASASAASDSSSALKITFIDVEGGQSTLFVTPDHHSLLIDTGWPGNEGRDADRIAKAAKESGISNIDYVLLTHFHVDHTGGVPQLVAKIPVGTFIDHGPNRETGDKVTADAYDAYQKVLASGHYGHLQPKPGDTLPIPGLKVTVISGDGDLISQPLPGAGQPNAFCAISKPRPADQTENARSLGVLIQFGELRILDLGDLTWDKEMQLMCPKNKIGHIDLFIVSHHGWSQSSSPAFVYGITPRVDIMDNGAKKGGSTSTLDIIRKTPHLEDLWQLHFSEEGGVDHNTDSAHIANLKGTDAGYPLNVMAWQDGSFEVKNPRDGTVHQYPASKK